MTVHQIHARPLVWTFGDRLRKVRRVNHLTQSEFADTIGKSAKAVDAWESDRNLPRDLVAVATVIETTFELPRGWMLGYADCPDSHPGRGDVELPHLDSNQKPAGFQSARDALVLAA